MQAERSLDDELIHIEDLTPGAETSSLMVGSLGSGRVFEPYLSPRCCEKGVAIGVILHPPHRGPPIH